MKLLRNYLVLLTAVLFLTGCQGKTNGEEDKDFTEALNSRENTPDSTGGPNQDPGLDETEPLPEEMEPVLQVAASFFVPGELAKSVGGELADVQTLVASGDNPVGYQMKEADRELLASCDVFIYSGGIADAWAEEALGFLREDAVVYSFKEGMSQLIADGVCPDFTGTGAAGEQEMYWIVPVNAMLLSSDISKIFAEMDPEHSAVYDRNFGAYVDELSEVDQEMAAALEQTSGGEFLFVGQTSYLGLAEEYQFHCHIAEDEAGAEALAVEMKSDGAGCFFYDELSEEGLVEAIRTKTGAEPVQVYSGIMVPEEAMEGSITFVELLRQNIECMGRAFGQT